MKGFGYLRAQQELLEGINRIFRQALVCQTEEELGRTCLTVAEELTQSRFGFIGLIDQQGQLYDIAISNPGWAVCRMDAQTGHCTLSSGLKIHGIYGRVLRDGKGFFTNNPATHPDSIGTPPGHPSLTAFLGVPLLDDQQVIGMVGLGNRAGGYRNKELLALEALAFAIVQALKRKQTEAALRESDNQFRAMFSSHSVGMAQADLTTGRMLRVNDVFAEMLGYTPAELVGRPFPELTHPDDRQADWQAFSRFAREESPGYQSEKRYLHKDGQSIWGIVTAELVRNEAGQPVRTVAIIHDISERKRMEETLLLANQTVGLERDLLQAVMNGAKNQHLVYLDRDFNFVRVNETYAQTCGYRPAEMIGKNHFALYPHAENEVIFTRVRDLGETMECHDRPFAFSDQPERGVTYWDWTLTPAKDADGKVMGLILSLYETTERKKSESALAAAKLAAEEANRAKSEFLATMSHEIRTPMTVISSAIEQLRTLDMVPEHRPLLELAEQANDRLTALINDILDFSRIEARRVALYQEPFDLRDTLQKTVTVMNTMAEKKGLSLDLKVSASAPEIMAGDAYRLEQVLVNLVGNAIKFTDKGRIGIVVRHYHGTLEFTVSDTGIGIPEEKLGQIFETFSQVDSSSTRRHGGTGLGLAITKGLVELMGGTITVNSQLGKGSQFIFTLPLTHRNAAEPANATARPELPAAVALAARILLVEDDAMVQKVILMVLSRRPWRVTTAKTGLEGVRRCQEEAFDLVLMDLQMPEMDGLEATREIRRLEEGSGKQVCIVGLTAHANRAVLQECLNAGMNSVLVKPFETDKLYAAIEAGLAG